MARRSSPPRGIAVGVAFTDRSVWQVVLARVTTGGESGDALLCDSSVTVAGELKSIGCQNRQKRVRQHV